LLARSARNATDFVTVDVACGERSGLRAIENLFDALAEVVVRESEDRLPVKGHASEATFAVVGIYPLTALVTLGIEAARTVKGFREHYCAARQNPSHMTTSIRKPELSMAGDIS
jgi:hypothetical protein